MRYQIRLDTDGMTWAWSLATFFGADAVPVEGMGERGYATAAEALADAEKALACLLALHQPGAAYMHGR